MKRLLLITIGLFLILKCFSQQDLLPAFPNEINYQGERAYFKGIPFTGLLVDQNNTNLKWGMFRNGYKMGLFTEYFSNGQKKYEGNFVNEVKEGLHTEWYENDSIKSEIIYLDGRKNGLSIFWYPNGQKKYSGNYNNDREDKTHIEWYDNGNKKMEISFSNGSKVGTSIEWDIEGNIVNRINHEELKLTPMSKLGVESLRKSTNNENKNEETEKDDKSAYFPKPDYIGYYNYTYSYSDYQNQDGIVYYILKNSDINTIKIDINGRSPIVKNNSIILNGIGINDIIITIKFIVSGFKKVGGKYSFYVSGTTIEDGEVFEKKENMLWSWLGDPLIIEYRYNPPSLKYGATHSHIMYANFLFKDRNSDAIIHGFYKFILKP